LITLAVTPVRRSPAGTIDPAARDAGLLAFFYGSLHFLTYIWLDQSSFSTHHCRRHGSPLITVGFASFASDPSGPYLHDCHDQAPGWQMVARLHRLVYAIPSAGVHYLWLVKAISNNHCYGGILAVLLVYGVGHYGAGCWPALLHRQGWVRR